jgi:TonB family protein
MNTTIKLISSISFIFASSIFCSAQDATLDLQAAISNTEKKEVKVEKEKPVLSPRQVYLNQTQMASNQMVQHLAENISLPDYLKDQYFEGEVIVEVMINQNGEIKKAKIHKSLQSELDQLVLASVLKMAQIDTDSTQYKGAHRLRIPVNFSFR